MESERTALWPRHKRRVYAQAEGFDNPQRADYRRLLNFLAKNTDLCQKVILHSASVPEFAAVRTIINRKLKADTSMQSSKAEVVEISEIDQMARDLLEQPIDDESVPQVVIEEPAKRWDDISDLLEEKNGEDVVDLYEEVKADDLFHTKPVSRGRFGRRRVASSLSKAIIDHAFKDEVPPPALQLVEVPDPLDEIAKLDIPENILAEFLQEKEIALDAEEEEEKQIEEPSEPVSETQIMLERWFGALDQEDEEESLSYVPEDEDVNALADNPVRLLKQLEAIAEGEKPYKDERAVSEPEIITLNKPCMIPLSRGHRQELYSNGSYVIKDSIGKVVAVRSQDGITITFKYDDEGILYSFTRYQPNSEIHSTGEKEKHGVIVRDPCGRVRAQGESMSCDPRGCLTIRKVDGQFWCIDLVRGIHIERRILEDLHGRWSSLTALLSFDGFRMATKFQELTDSYRRYGDWLSSTNSSRFRFYGRDGSVIQFNSDEELQSLRPSTISGTGTRKVDEELRGYRQARTAWDSVHEYVSQYLATL